MVRSVIGGLIAGIVMFFIGFAFWGTPLSQMAFSKANDTDSAVVQNALAQSLTRTGTGTYLIPTPSTPQGTVAYGRGPIATIHFNTGGFAANDLSMMVPGLIFALVSGLLMSFGIAAVSRENAFPQIARLVVLFSLGITCWTILAQPVFNNFGWAYWIYFFISESVAFIVAGLIVARWFVPKDAAVATAQAPAEPRSEA